MIIPSCSNNTAWHCIILLGDNQCCPLCSNTPTTACGTNTVINYSTVISKLLESTIQLHVQPRDRLATPCLLYLVVQKNMALVFPTPPTFGSKLYAMSNLLCTCNVKGLVKSGNPKSEAFIRAFDTPKSTLGLLLVLLWLHIEAWLLTQNWVSTVYTVLLS